MAQLAFVAIAAAATKGAGAATAALAMGAAAAAGAIIDSTLIFPAIFGKNQDTFGPRLDDLQLQTASEGAPMHFVAGEARCSGEVIWVGPLIETEESSNNGGKGGSGNTATNYSYRNSVAIGVCEGPVTAIKKIWADSRIIWRQDGFRNLLRWSDQFDQNTVWQVNPEGYESISVQPNATTDALGGNKADKITVALPGDETELAQRGVPLEPSTQYTFSIYHKSGTLTTNYISIWDRTNRTVVVSLDPVAMTGSWARYTYTFTTAASSDGSQVLHDFIVCGYPPTAGDFYLFGAQLEEGASATDYEDVDSVSVAQEGTSYKSLTVHYGTHDQAVDSVIEAVEGAGNVPAHRGLCYITVEELLLTRFGNRIPQFSFQVAETTDMTAPQLMGKLLQRAGLAATDYVINDMWDSPIRGLLAAGPQSPIRLMEPVLIARNLMVVESEGKIKVIQREKSTARDVPEAHLAAHVPGDDTARPATFTDIGTYSLPAEVEVMYLDPDLDFQRGMMTERRSVWQSDAVKRIELPLVLSSHDARNIAYRGLWTAWSERRGIEVYLPPQYINVEETDLLSVTRGSETHQVRCTSVTRGNNFILHVKGVIESSESVSGSAGASASAMYPANFASADAQGVYEAAAVHLAVMDIPALREEDLGVPGFYWAAASDTGDDWRGASLYTAEVDASMGTYLDKTTVEAVMGTTDTPLPDGTTYGWDYASSVTVTLYGGTLESKTADQVIDGGNWMLVGDEIIGFQTATLVGTNKYTLSGLLRGLRGTENAVEGHASGETVVLLNSALRYKVVASSVLDVSRYYRAVPAGGAVEDFSSQVSALVLAGNTLKPFMPVDIEGTRDGSNNLTITWERQSRSFFPVAPELTGEAVRLPDETNDYEIDVLDGSDAVLRTIVVSDAVTAGYTAAEQTTDGLTPGDPVTINVYQLSSVIGRGFAGRATV